MNNDNTIQSEQGPIPSSAVSIYGGADAMDDFPVLKAFQQYIDAEQAKAQKRMTTLCILFAIVLAAVIGVFLLLLANVSQRNATLNDRLIEYVMSGRAQAADSRQDSAANVKELKENIEEMKRQLAEEQRKTAEKQNELFARQAKALEERAAILNAQSRQDAENEKIALEKKNKAASEKIKKAAALLAEEKKKIDGEKELLRKREAELKRQKAALESRAAAARKPSPKPATQKTAAPHPAASAPKTYFDEETLDLDSALDNMKIELDGGDKIDWSID